MNTKIIIIFLCGPTKERIECDYKILRTNSPVLEARLTSRWHGISETIENEIKKGIKVESDECEDDLDDLENEIGFGEKIQILYSTNEVELADVEASTFRNFISFISNERHRIYHYWADELVHTELIDLLLFSDEYQVTFLFQKCAASLSKREIRVESVIETYQTALLYDMDDVIKKASEFIVREFSKLIAEPSFVLVDQKFLLKFLPKDELDVSEIKLIDAISRSRWLEFQCSKQNIEETWENKRQVLGDALFHIRFPTLSIDEFSSSKNSLLGILSPKEVQEILEFINSTHKETTNASKLRFCTKKRMRSARFLEGYHVADMICNFRECFNGQRSFRLKVNQRIEVHSVGFLGPIDFDAVFQVTIEFTKDEATGSHSTGEISCGRLKKRVSVGRAQIFFVTFEEPVILEAANTECSDWEAGEFYNVKFSLKDSNAPCQKQVVGSPFKDFKTQTDDTEFCCEWGICPLAELRFTPSSPS